MEWFQRRVHGGPSQTQKCSRFFSTSRITPVPTARPVTPPSRRPTSSSSPPARTRLIFFYFHSGFCIWYYWLYYFRFWLNNWKFKDLNRLIEGDSSFEFLCMMVS